jgi:hypothetical protein
MQQVQHDDGRVWIEGVPDAPIGHGWDMLLRGLQTLLRHRGEPARLEELMALSGDAFNLCFASHWQATAYLAVPTDTLSNAATSLGYAGRWLLPMPDDEIRTLPEDERRRVTDQVLGQMMDEIDAGRPVLAGGCADQGCGPWSVVVGYDREGPALCHVGLGEPYRWVGVRGIVSRDQVVGYWNGRVRGAARPGFVGGWMADPAFLLGAKGPVPAPRRRVIGALKRALAVFRAPYHRIPQWGGVTYYFGREAYLRWAEALRELDYPADLQGDRPENAYDWYDMGGLAVLVDCIVRGRSAAAAFCAEAADVLGNAKANLSAAARFYRRQTGIAAQAFQPFIAGTDEERVAWLSDPQRREAGALAVETMLDAERAAVREVELALEAEKGEVPAAFTHAHEHLVRARRQPFGPPAHDEEEDEEGACPPSPPPRAGRRLPGRRAYPRSAPRAPAPRSPSPAGRCRGRVRRCWRPRADRGR